MRPGDVLGAALAGLAQHKARAALSTLGVVFGVASVVAVVAVAEGGKTKMARILEAMGATNVRVRARNFEDDLERRTEARKRSMGLVLAEVEHLGDRGLYPVFASYAPVKYLRAYGLPVSVRMGEKVVSSPAVVGTTPSYLDVMSYSLREGRFFTEAEELEAVRACVLEDEMARELKPVGSAVGSLVVIDHEPYEVVGVLARKETSDDKYAPAAEPSPDGARPPARSGKRTDELDEYWRALVNEQQINRRIYVPLSCALRRSTQSRKTSEIDEAVFRAVSTEALSAAKDAISRFLIAAHSMRELAPEARDFAVEIPMELVRQKQEQQRVFNWVMGATAAISLLVGGIGIMNIMLASVTERRREIGIRRAVGASERDVLGQFVTEVLAICVMGGCVGLALGWVMSRVISALAGYATEMALWGAGVGLFVSIADGLVFGIYPAYRAAKLDPIDALKSE